MKIPKDMNEYESSKIDRMLDKKSKRHAKEGSEEDIRADKEEMARMKKNKKMDIDQYMAMREKELARKGKK